MFLIKTLNNKRKKNVNKRLRIDESILNEEKLNIY